MYHFLEVLLTAANKPGERMSRRIIRGSVGTDDEDDSGTGTDTLPLPSIAFVSGSGSGRNLSSLLTLKLPAGMASNIRPRNGQTISFHHHHHSLLTF